MPNVLTFGGKGLASIIRAGKADVAHWYAHHDCVFILCDETAESYRTDASFWGRDQDWRAQRIRVNVLAATNAAIRMLALDYWLECHPDFA